MIIYIHGFNSSPASYKAQILLSHMKNRNLESEIVIPALSFIPGKAISELKVLAQRYADRNLAFIGSSLGGFYATWLAEYFDCRAVLVNPAVRPFELLENYLGINTNHYTGESYEMTHQHIDELKMLDVEVISKPQNLFVLLQTGDEVLDYHQAAQKYSDSEMIIEQGGDHSFTDFERHIHGILSFCGKV